ncbi:MAG TPA: hypothetical protein VGQ41_24295 [Pyrinomonadaceae bacterium]|jgi:hypothetical protein|nr:hypothetical protein [Pyrinomonadaceae bacterium]
MFRRRATTTAALIVLVCFFLPWIQVSCGATRETASGIDLARDGSHGLWLIPLLMLAILFFGSAKAWKERHQLSILLTLVSGLVSAYLMNRERLKFEDSSGLIRVGVTGWFWLGLGSSVAIIILAAFRFLTRGKSDSPV